MRVHLIGGCRYPMLGRRDLNRVPLSWIGRFGPQACGTLYPQAVLAAWLTTALQRSESLPGARIAQKLYRRLLQADTVASRVSCVPDALSTDPRDWRLFAGGEKTHADASPEQWYEPSLERRMQLYSEVAQELAFAAFAADELSPAYLMQVSCTGYESPSAVQRLIAARGWGQTARYLHLGHMGCYAAIPALVVASSLAHSLPSELAPEHVRRSVDLLHIELCTLHFNATACDPDQIVVQHLFADGAIRYEVAAEPLPGVGFALLGSFERMLPSSTDAMGWQLASTGFRMSLARNVPAFIARSLPGLVADFLEEWGLHRNDIDRFVVHPGGPKVIDGVAACLEIPEEKLTHSREVLYTRGNMSSATLPHIWHALATDPRVVAGELVLSLAFGPGLTVTGNLMRKLET